MIDPSDGERMLRATQYPPSTFSNEINKLIQPNTVCNINGLAPSVEEVDGLGNPVHRGPRNSKVPPRVSETPPSAVLAMRQGEVSRDAESAGRLFQAACNGPSACYNSVNGR